MCTLLAIVVRFIFIMSSWYFHLIFHKPLLYIVFIFYAFNILYDYERTASSACAAAVKVYV